MATKKKKKKHNPHVVSSVVVRVTWHGVSPHPPVLLRRMEHLRHCKALTIHTVGARANGQVLADLIRQCDNVHRIHVDRRDNDWDAQETTFVLVATNVLAQGLKEHATLQDLSILGLSKETVGLDSLVESLITIPSLTCVTLKAEPTLFHNQTHHLMMNHPLLTPASLQALLDHVTHRLSLAGMFPEHHDYQQVLFRAFVTHHAKVHIYMHFSASLQPSPFCYFLRHVMELNQQQQQQGGKDSNDRILHLLVYMAQQQQKRSNNHANKASTTNGSSSLDAAYWMIRQNPWLCQRRSTVSLPTTGRMIKSSSSSQTELPRWRRMWRGLFRRTHQ